MGVVETGVFAPTREGEDDAAAPRVEANARRPATDHRNDNDLPVARSERDARFALPGGGGVHVALLFDGDSVDGARALAELGRSALVGWCALLNPVGIDTAKAPNVRQWFGLQTLPALVAIWDGAILAIEYDFDPPALQSLAAAAVKRYRELVPA